MMWPFVVVAHIWEWDEKLSVDLQASKKWHTEEAWRSFVRGMG